MPDKSKRVFFAVKIFFVLTLFFTFCPEIYATQEIPGERLVERELPSPVIPEEKKKKGEWSLSAFFERSDIVQGARFGHWNEWAQRIGYSFDNIQLYTYASQIKRFQERDYTGNFGTYFNFNKYYIHEELGFGTDVDFIYKFQNILEVSHKFTGNLYWQGGYNFRNYKVNDTHLFYPGLIYYFGDNYVGLDYGVSIIESRGNAQFGTVRSDFALNKFLHWSLGAAIGERLYDIFELSPGKEYSYIIFSGFNVNLYKSVDFRIGYSYGMEKPRFIKRSLNFGLSCKF